MKVLATVLLFWGVMFAAQPGLAADVQIKFAELTQHDSTWSADVTLRHEDTGWDNYADAWRLVDESGKVLATRVLWHPHVDEQPFTRGMGDIHIPADTRIIYVEAHGKVEGWSRQRLRIDLQQTEGEGYRIR